MIEVNIRHGHYRDSDTTWCGKLVYEPGHSYGDPTYWAVHYGKTYQDENYCFAPCKECEKTNDSVMALLGYFA